MVNPGPAHKIPDSPREGLETLDQLLKKRR